MWISENDEYKQLQHYNRNEYKLNTCDYTVPASAAIFQANNTRISSGIPLVNFVLAFAKTFDDL